MRFVALITLALAMMLVAGCPGHQHLPLTFEQEEALRAKEQCTNDASLMNDPPHNSRNHSWKSYFEMCMRRFGVSDKELGAMWY